MSVVDVVLVLLIACMVALAVRHMVRTRKSGGCGCGYEGCGASCEAREPRTTRR